MQGEQCSLIHKQMTFIDQFILVNQNTVTSIVIFLRYILVFIAFY